ncbi:MAG: GntR family transcriptional regulator [Acidobacteriota bacterium]
MTYLDLHVRPGDGRPLYRQLIEQILAHIASGQLRPGERLPSVRRLAEQLVINPNTVARAYRDLEAAGTLASRPRSGVFVAGGVGSAGALERDLADAIDRVLAAARALGLDADALDARIEARREQLLTGTEG